MLNPYIEAWQLREMVVRKGARPKEVAEFFLARIERLNPKLNAFMTVTAERALADAARLEKSDPDSMALYGVPYSLKDLTPTKGIRTTFGSRNFADNVPNADIEFAVRLHKAGGILLGKTAPPEFGGRPTTEGGLCPPARNPWNVAHTTGGFSGGAAAAVAAGLNPLAEGSDGGGSVRIPSACCGTVGLKPSRGHISLAPVWGELWGGLFTNGPITRSVRDAAMMLDVMAVEVAGDPYFAPRSVRTFQSALQLRPTKLRLATLSKSALGHELEPVDIDPAADLVGCFGNVVAGNIAAVAFKDPELIDPIVRVFYEAGRTMSATQYINAVLEMHNKSRAIVQRLMPYDALLTPMLARPAMLIYSRSIPFAASRSLRRRSSCRVWRVNCAACRPWSWCVLERSRRDTGWLSI